MKEYHIHADSTIILNLRLRGGAPTKGRIGLGGSTQLGSGSKQKQPQDQNRSNLMRVYYSETFFREKNSL